MPSARRIALRAPAVRSASSIPPAPPKSLPPSLQAWKDQLKEAREHHEDSPCKRCGGAQTLHLVGTAMTYVCLDCQLDATYERLAKHEKVRKLRTRLSVAVALVALVTMTAASATYIVAHMPARPTTVRR